MPGSGKGSLGAGCHELRLRDVQEDEERPHVRCSLSWAPLLSAVLEARCASFNERIAIRGGGHVQH